jgi:hypothetical protein
VDAGRARTFSDARSSANLFWRDPSSERSVANRARDFIALNMGKNGVAFNFAAVPAGTATLCISRSIASPGPWIVAVRVRYTSDIPQPLVDLVDGTKHCFYYRLQALSHGNRVLKTYGIIRVPAYQSNKSELSPARH